MLFGGVCVCVCVCWLHVLKFRILHTELLLFVRNRDRLGEAQAWVLALLPFKIDI